ncbi:TetR/AcrR family transcriptional regulator [Streptomyces globisporus]|uniref:TetR/AcrR family transcriptional regulator n=1 Tax=Streptomyces globisporus TaxID=1908 RepID=UPI003675157B
MPRLAEARKPAEPASERQVERWDRILGAAAELGADTAYEQVQMQEIARASDVALGTLYRYFPSKVQLFATVFAARVARFIEEEWPVEDGDAVEVVGERLVGLNRRLMEQPVLCGSMVRATATNYADRSEPQAPVPDSHLYDAVLRTLGEDDPCQERVTAVRMLVYSWWGVLFSELSGRTTPSEARYEIGLAARRLLARDAPRG